MAQFELTRIAPSEALAPFVENYWIITWDLTGKPPYEQANLPHPSQHIVVDPQSRAGGVFGVQLGTFTYLLKQSGRVFGTKFHPGAFRAFFPRPASELTGRSVPIAAIFNADDAELNRRLLAYNDPLSFAQEIEKLLLAKAPVSNARMVEARRLVEVIADESDLRSVSALARRTGLQARSLQHLFSDYTGVSPKWVIDRYRMLEAVDALNRDEPVSLTELAHELGYFDQAHFSHSFQALTGHPPSHFRARSDAYSAS
jgi:AraC-like DNA-binding protein